ncbi:MAG TPA: SPW repeat protein [Vicinamibacterales bacterium]|nr:SPW repeat protein [Vicinamibacterales bacterium]
MKWASWVNFLLGLWLIVAPFAMGFGVMRGVAANDVVFGILIAVFALWSLTSLVPPPAVSWLVAIFGLWVLISPAALAYGGISVVASRTNVVTGVIVLILGIARAISAGHHRVAQA